MSITPKLAGKKFGKLTVIRRDGYRRTQAAWLCRCECGNTFRAPTGGLLRGQNKSCGCLKHRLGMDNPTAIHGHSPKVGPKSPEFRAYNNARQRCINPHNISYKYYGGRGIEFRYESFVEFLKDVGKRPSQKHSLDRINNDGHYEKRNCRWSTHEVQVNNRRIKVITEFSDDDIRKEFYRRKLNRQRRRAS